MPKAAIGVFQSPAAAKRAVGDLERSGCDRTGIRMIAEPTVIAEDDADPGKSTARTDFEVSLVRQLMQMGVPKEDAQSYRESLRRGGVLVAATGADSQVDAAAETMNQAGAADVEEMTGRVGVIGAGVSRDPGQIAFGDLDVQAGRVRSTGGGARVFVW